MRYKKDFVQIDVDKKTETHNLVWYLFSHIVFYVLLLFFGIFFAWYTVFVTTHIYFDVKGPSMMPSLNNQITVEQLHTLSNDDLSELSYDAVFVDKTNNIKVFDIVVVDSTPQIDNDSIIKRLIAKEGDYVSIAQDEDGLFRVFRIASGTDLQNVTNADAKLLEEGENGYFANHLDWEKEKNQKTDGKYTYDKLFYNTFLQDKTADLEIDGLKYVKVPKDRVFCLGDNRAYSSDSRESSRKFFATSSLVGRCEIVVYNANFANRIWEVVKFYFSEVEKFFAR